jgi:hypothetical protein
VSIDSTLSLCLGYGKYLLFLHPPQTYSEGYV